MITEQPILTLFVWPFYRLSWLFPAFIYLFFCDILRFLYQPWFDTGWRETDSWAWDCGLMGTIWWRKILKNSTGRQLPLYHNEYEEIVQKNKRTTTKTTERQRFGLSMRKTLIYSWASAAIMFLWMDFWFTTIARFHSYDEIYVFKCEYVF